MTLLTARRRAGRPAGETMHHHQGPRFRGSIGYVCAVGALLAAAALACGHNKPTAGPSSLDGGTGDTADAGAADLGPQPDGATGAPAFPGAVGWARTTAGGRGGQILRVTNLAINGPGSLTDALLTSGPRVIVFEVGGVID